MYEIVIEPAFKNDYQHIKHCFPEIVKELKIALEFLQSEGSLPDECNAHELTNPGGNYNGYIDFHLLGNEIDVIVLCRPHKTNPSIRMVRIGTHEDLFRGSLK